MLTVDVKGKQADWVFFVQNRGHEHRLEVFLTDELDEVMFLGPEKVACLNLPVSSQRGPQNTICGSQDFLVGTYPLNVLHGV